MEMYFDDIIDGVELSEENLKVVKSSISKHVDFFSEELAIDNIKEIYFSGDFAKKANQVRKKHGYDSSDIVDRDGAIAYYFSINEGYVLVYDNSLIGGLLSYQANNMEKSEKQAFNLFLHELLHVHDNNIRNEMEIMDDEASMMLLTDPLNIWAEYYAHRKAAESFKVHENNVYYDILKDCINDTPYDQFALELIARKIGDINSTSRLENVKNDFVVKMEEILNDLYVTFPNWDSLNRLIELRYLIIE